MTTSSSNRQIPTFHPNPNIEKGVEYWQSVPATVDGVLGGYGNGTLPIVDAQGSRTFLLEMLPRLSSIPPSSASIPSSSIEKQDWLNKKIAERGGSGRSITRALDCGAGVGRVTRDVLSKLVDIVHIVEPVESFLEAAKSQSNQWQTMKLSPEQTPFQARKSIHFHLSTLQNFDPSKPYSSSKSIPTLSSSFSKSSSLNKKNKLQKLNGSSFFEPTLAKSDEEDFEKVLKSKGALEAISKQEPIQFDIIWGQWCLQHLSDKDLISFLIRSKNCLKKPSIQNNDDDDKNSVLDGSGIIVVKENVLRSSIDGSERVWYDEEDHSITRTPNAYERCFKQAGLEIVKTQLQLGLPEELLPVQIWCLRIPRNSE